MKRICVFLFFAVAFCYAKYPLERFISIQGATFFPGTGDRQSKSPVRVDDFEILDHPVTNLEYKAFIDATRYSAPLHWKDGKIPDGKEDCPVVFVNRQDVRAYLNWLGGKDGRKYRLPTSREFELAARGGLVGKIYPWGNEKPSDRANYDANRDREFAHWEKYLQPSRWGARNGFGLWGMAGNVWQLIQDSPDPAMADFRYRVDDPIEQEKRAMGGSWARSEAYLKCGVQADVFSSAYQPDVGFRPVRQPEHADWTVQPRRLSAVSQGDGKILMGWALLANDNASTGFHVYRSDSRSHAGFRVTKQPLTRQTTFIDTGLTPGERIQYHVKSVDPSGKEGRRSEWLGVTATKEFSGVLTSFRPLYHQGSLVPIFGDVNGDGAQDCVIRMDNGNQEKSQDPGIPVQLEAFASYGRSLWRKDICCHDHCFGNANNVPFNVWDMDGDGRAEVITRLQSGDSVYVAILNGMTGEVKKKAPWIKMVSDFARSSTRIHLSVGYLDGRHPAVVTQSGLYENEIFTAYDADLNRLWQFRSFAETNGSGGHKIEMADVNGDGTQEVFDGTTCLNSDGTVRWSIYRGHPDIVSIHDYLPKRPGLEVFYIVENGNHAGVYLVDANTGEILWKVNREDDPRWTHGHVGWSADIWEGSPGLECVSNRDGHYDRNMVLFSADGRVLLEPFPFGFTPLEWDGSPARELISTQTNRIGRFNGREIIPLQEGQPVLPAKSGVIMTADLYGDFRDELVLSMTDENQKRYIAVWMSTQPLEKKFVTPNETLEYRLWLARNMGGGYRSVYDQPLSSPK